MHAPFLAAALAALLASTPSAEPAATAQPTTAAPPARPEPVEGRAAAAARSALEAEIAKALGTAPSPAAAPAPAAGGGSQPGGAGALGRVLMLPDLSAIGSFAAAWDSYDVGALSPRDGALSPKDKPALLFRELELGLQAVVDPYLRADVFISFTPEEVAVEEAYVTSLSLPAGLQVRAGRFFSPFGRLNAMHPHTWDFVDPPLARGRLIATETLSGPGADVGWLAPLPWFADLRVAIQSTDPFGSGEERLTGTARLGQYVALSDGMTLGLGLSAARRDEGAGAFRDLGNVDLMVRYRQLDSRASWTLSGELTARRFRGSATPLDGGNGVGGWAQLVWRRDAWWSHGIRYDEAPSGGDAAPGTERRWSAVTNWYPSEFSRLALQVSRDERPGGQAGWESILHLEFIMGAHGAHPF